ncbi:MAG: GDSL-type esterase/lipase family protein, partial [Myxococcota bacterium]|nr:GDSL-type esterase/lipase family protein [Myxococcota bacterium]
MRSLRLRLASTIAMLGSSSLSCAGQSHTAKMATPPTDIAALVRLPDTDEGLPGAGPIRRYEGFAEHWRERRLAWSRRVAEDQGAVVFVGDSITEGWGDDMGRSFPGLKVANRGIGGDTSRGVLIRLDGDVLALHPRGVVILVGTNDVEEGAPPDTIAGNVALVLEALRASDPALPILLCEVFPSSPSQRRPRDRITRLNQRYASLVSGKPQVT